MWSTPVDVGFTVVFVATGVYALLRWAGLRAGTTAHGDQVAELSHVVMSLAMVAMVWNYGGSAATVLQIVVFGGFAGYFAVRGWRNWRRGNAHVVGSAAHLVLCLAMAWMVPTMPALMGHQGGGGAAMDMPGMVMDGGGDALLSGPAPGWMAALTVVFAVLAFAAAAVWLRGMLTRVTGPGVLFAARTEASCHVLMALGMAAMLLLTV